MIQYRTNQFSSVEAKLQNQLTLMWNIVSIAAIAYRCRYVLTWRGLGTALQYSLVSAVLGYLGAITVMTHTVRRLDRHRRARLRETEQSCAPRVCTQAATTITAAAAAAAAAAIA